MNTSNRSGYTLLELLLAIMAGAILGLTVGTALLTGFTTWHQSTQTLETHRDVSLAMEAFGKMIREAWWTDEVRISSNKVQVMRGSVQLAQMKRDVNELDFNGFPLIRDGLEKFEVTEVEPDKSYSIVLAVKDPGGTGTMEVRSLYKKRN